MNPEALRLAGPHPPDCPEVPRYDGPEGNPHHRCDYVERVEEIAALLANQATYSLVQLECICGMEEGLVCEMHRRLRAMEAFRVL